MQDTDGQRVAIVTGGAIRVGEAISRRLVQAGYHVVVHAFSSSARAKALADEIGGSWVCSDLTTEDGVELIFEHVDGLGQPLKVLVNNAAMFEPDAPDLVDKARWDAHFQLNVRAPFRAAQLAAERMRRCGGGSIVNLLDIAAMRPETGYAHYSATKAALESLTYGLAAEWAPMIRVNGVAPGAALMPTTFTEAERNIRLERTPMKEEPGANALADTVAFLVDGPRAITGAVVPVDGGLSVTW